MPLIKVRTAVITLAAITFSTALATGALAAGRDGGAGTGGEGEGEFRDGYTGGPSLDRGPETPPPVFNPSTPYTVPAPRETPVSPASPGSVFGNGR
jgi:hypothetical protein